MSKKSLVSVIIPAFNTENYIKECVDSIVNQTYDNLEILIYNDGSTDNTLEILKQYRDSRIRVYTNSKNRGVSHARNVLLEKAQGGYIMYQDSDDISFENRIEILVKHIRECGFTFICTALRWMHNGKVFTFEENPHRVLKYQFMRHKPLSHATSIFKRQVIDAGIRYDESLLAGEDLLFESEVQARFPLQMKAYNKVLYIYRKRVNSLTSQKKSGAINIAKELAIRDGKIVKILKPLFEKYCKDI
jgi:glycosyltransferase involved in cell wall biosynthesis